MFFNNPYLFSSNKYFAMFIFTDLLRNYVYHAFYRQDNFPDKINVFIDMMVFLCKLGDV